MGSAARECDVHRIVYGDRQPKPDVEYCPDCRAWICAECRGRKLLRGAAASLRTLDELMRGLGLAR